MKRGRLFAAFRWLARLSLVACILGEFRWFRRLHGGHWKLIKTDLGRSQMWVEWGAPDHAAKCRNCPPCQREIWP